MRRWEKERVPEVREIKYKKDKKIKENDIFVIKEKMRKIGEVEEAIGEVEEATPYV